MSKSPWDIVETGSQLVDRWRTSHHAGGEQNLSLGCNKCILLRIPGRCPGVLGLSSPRVFKGLLPAFVDIKSAAVLLAQRSKNALTGWVKSRQSATRFSAWSAEPFGLVSTERFDPDDEYPERILGLWPPIQTRSYAT